MCVPKGVNYPAGHSVQIHNKDPIQIFVVVPAVYFPHNSQSALRMQSRQHFLFLSQAKNKEVGKDAEPRQMCNRLKFSEDNGDSTFYVHSLQLHLILSSAWKEILIVSLSSSIKLTVFFSEYSKKTDTDLCEMHLIMCPDEKSGSKYSSGFRNKLSISGSSLMERMTRTSMTSWS